MNRSTKAALAAAAAAFLLLGGAGSLAYWNSTQTVAGGSIASGTLTLTQEAGQSCTAWTLDAAGGSTTYTAGNTLVVPGDVITKDCDFTVTASGAHLAADLTMAAPSFTGDSVLAGKLSPAATYTLDGNAVSSGRSITSADDGAVLHATITVTFDTATSGVTAQGMAAGLDDIVIGLQQTHA